ncbi:excisionase family DNA-binding protein [Myceligenerans salitolerans]|uniref:Excisionase family DNA-binding protein n=1 Tax=Myceligenerans salitolerans TaxID=1230528 RepID=A0ABS3IC57_9MICO|nr:excisionase family DNA-binding protein [Myceligenerans salitolerans]MBO0610601.1 excisionase family DNA-binding protein [Myceligenerans salitolerans]
MSDLLARDAAAVHHALERGGDDVSLSIHRSTAELVAALLDARAHGVPEEVTPTRAAELLGVSRPHVRRLMDRGELPFRKVGSHHRLPLAAVEAFRERERARRAEALADLSELQNELGLTE